MNDKGMKKKFLISRRVWIVAAICLQVVFFVILMVRFNEYFSIVYGTNLVLSLFALLFVLNSNINPSYKIAWIIPIMIFPIFGGIVYFVFGRGKLSQKTSAQMCAHEKKVKDALRIQKIDAKDVFFDTMSDWERDAIVQSEYISSFAGYPPYQEGHSAYLPTGEQKFDRLREELEKAEHYIFMEYYIIEEGVMWNQILEILQRKAEQGVDVRLIYDDVGCMFTLPYRYDKQLEGFGIQCCIFNPLVPVLSFRLNNRDHRKITVIDGHTGFAGGINLADEYINEYEKYGHWKDTAILLKGEAVWNMTVMFLAMWDYLKGVEEDFSLFNPHMTGLGEMCEERQGYVQPFADSPLDHEPVGETVYLNLIYKAKKLVYITTPYLIIANEMVKALCTAAKGGVDVRIITPHKWDKRLVHMVTQTYYKLFIESGVKIYEYTPGFMHAKTFVVDDIYGVVGTINMDYRSLYLHFENAVWLYKTPSVLEMKNDFLNTLKVCKEMTLKDLDDLKWYSKLLSFVLRVFAPFL